MFYCRRSIDTAMKNTLRFTLLFLTIASIDNLLLARLPERLLARLDQPVASKLR